MSKPRSGSNLSKSAFHALLRKAAQPIQGEEELPSQEESETSESHPSGGYSATRKHQDTTEGNMESLND